MGFMGYFMQHQTLYPTLTTTIRYLVSVEFDHQYCANFNGQMLAKMGGLSEDQLKSIGANPEGAPLDEKGKAMLLFVLKALKSPETVETKDVDSLRNLGWSDQDIYKPQFTAPIWLSRVSCSRLSGWEKNRASEPGDANSNFKRQEVSSVCIMDWWTILAMGLRPNT